MRLLVDGMWSLYSSKSKRSYYILHKHRIQHPITKPNQYLWEKYRTTVGKCDYCTMLAPEAMRGMLAFFEWER